jgi:hypothetical protein
MQELEAEGVRASEKINRVRFSGFMDLDQYIDSDVA